MYKISQVPKINYLNDEVEILSKIMINNIKNIILEYFYKCHGCNYYFDENLIGKCNCRIWCNYCLSIYVVSDVCNFCINGKEVDIYDRKHKKCHYESCNNNANYGNDLYPFYCQNHTLNKILISYFFLCDIKECVNRAPYIDNKFGSLCYQHKNDKCTFLFKEGNGYIDETPKFQCHNCQNYIVVKYVCNCGIIRCSKCTVSNNFMLKYEKESVIVCNECIFKFDIQRNQCECIILDVNCAVNNCSKKPIYYNPLDLNYFCQYHYNFNCLSTGKKCKYTNCLAICTIKSQYCNYHNLELAKYNI
jgi:hypothetical protein